MLTPDATLNGLLFYLTTRRTKIGSKSGDLILFRLLTDCLFIYLYSFTLFIIFHFKIVGSTPLIMHWYSSLVTLSSIEIITFLVQLLIWHLEENYIIQISRLVGRTQKQKENISLKKQRQNKNKNKKSPKLKQTKTQKIQKTPPPKKKKPPKQNKKTLKIPQYKHISKLNGKHLEVIHDWMTSYYTRPILIL